MKDYTIIIREETMAISAAPPWVEKQRVAEEKVVLFQLCFYIG